MTDTPTGFTRRRVTAGAAFLTGLAVPSLFAGRVPLGVALVLAAVALAIAGPRPSAADLRRWLRRPLCLAVAATFAIWLIGVPGSMNPGRSLMIWGQSAALLLVAAYFHWWLAQDRRARAIVLKTLVGTALFGAAIGATALYVWYGVLDPFRTRSIENFYDAHQALRAYGSLAPVLAPAVLSAGMALGGRWRAVSIAVVLLGAAIVQGADANAGMLGYGALALALLVGWLFIALPQIPARLLAAALFAIAVAAAYVLVTLVPAPPYACEALALPTWMIDAHRQIIWGFALDRAADAPWLGYGIDVGGGLPGAETPLPECIGQNYMPSHAHNWMIEMLVETGLFGLAGAVAALLLFARGLVQRAARRQQGALAALALAGAFWGSGLVNFSIWAAWWQTSFVVLTAITLSAAAAPATPAAAATPRGDAPAGR